MYTEKVLQNFSDFDIIKVKLLFGYGDIMGTLAMHHKLCQLCGNKKLSFRVSPKRKWHYQYVKELVREFKCEDFEAEVIIDQDYRKPEPLEYSDFYKNSGVWRMVREGMGEEFFGYPFEHLQPKTAPTEGNYIACWHTKNNFVPVNKKKNPIGDDKIIEYAESLGYDVKYISYMIPIEETLETIRNAKVCIGYEGVGQFISQGYMKPLVTFCQLAPWISEFTGGPWSLLTNKVTDKMMNIDHIIEEQKNEIEKYRPRCYRN